MGHSIGQKVALVERQPAYSRTDGTNVSSGGPTGKSRHSGWAGSVFPASLNVPHPQDATTAVPLALTINMFPPWPMPMVS